MYIYFKMIRASCSLNFLVKVVYKVKMFKILQFYISTLLPGLLENENKLEEKGISL